MSKTLRLIKENPVLRISKGSHTLSIGTVRVAAATTGAPPVADDRVGWIRIVDITVPGVGSTSDGVYQDPPGNTVLQSITVSDATFDVLVESSFPLVLVDGNAATLPLVGSVYRGIVQITLAATGDVVAQALNTDGNAAAEDTITVTIDTPPILLTLSFSGGYPGSQTELKAGDTYQLTGTTDKLTDGIQVQDFEAADVEVILPVAPTTTFLVTMTIGDRGTSVQALAARVRARASTTGGLGPSRTTDELGGSNDGIDLVNLNNIFPSLSVGAADYPGIQEALKGVEAATVVNTATDFSTIAYDDPVSEISFASPTVFENPKTVTRIGGTYNVSVANFRMTANRAANDATTVETGVVNIANAAPLITISEPAARLRSGGNDGTAVQAHAITISSNQNLLSVPSLDADSGGSRGTFAGAFSGGPAVYTADLDVADTDEKGAFTWESLVATGLSGIVTNLITGDPNYVLGGFVARTLTFAAFNTTTAMGVEVVDFSKLTAGIFTATNQAALKQPIGTSPSVTDGFTIDALAINPTDIIWLDTPASSANSGGTATITNVEETV